VISFVDEHRQWFKARIGLSVVELLRDISFSTYATAQRHLFIVPDAAADPRFVANPLVTGESQIRFYAGAPLFTPEGHALGTLSVMDRVPRELDRSQEEALLALARQVSAQLELRRRTHGETDAAVSRLAAIVECSAAAIIGKDLDGIVTNWNRGAEKLFGYTAAEMTGVSISRLVPSELRGEEERIRAQIRRGEIVAEFETIRLTKDGRRIEVSVTASPIEDETGNVIGASKLVRDISDCKRADEELRFRQAMLTTERELTLVRDVTERRRAERAVRDERDRAQRYLDTAEVILLALDTNGLITLINRKGCDVLG
jgi:PAS domain S-box-containing protein